MNECKPNSLAPIILSILSILTRYLLLCDELVNITVEVLTSTDLDADRIMHCIMMAEVVSIYSVFLMIELTKQFIETGPPEELQTLADILSLTEDAICLSIQSMRMTERKLLSDLSSSTRHLCQEEVYDLVDEAYRQLNVARSVIGKANESSNIRDCLRWTKPQLRNYQNEVLMEW